MFRESSDFKWCNLRRFGDGVRNSSAEISENGCSFFKPGFGYDPGRLWHRYKQYGGTEEGGNTDIPETQKTFGPVTSPVVAPSPTSNATGDDVQKANDDAQKGDDVQGGDDKNQPDNKADDENGEGGEGGEG